MSVIIRPFEPGDQAPARRLILNGLGEHFGFIDETRNPDLDDIETNYLQRGDVFLVAKDGEELVGTGGLIAEDTKTARIVRMSVSCHYRRKGIGRTLVTHLLAIAQQRNFARVIISTDVGWEDAIGLYTRCGFTEYACDNVGVYFTLTLIPIFNFQ